MLTKDEKQSRMTPALPQKALTHLADIFHCLAKMVTRKRLLRKTKRNERMTVYATEDNRAPEY
jgi:hypothetical protein